MAEMTLDEIGACCLGLTFYDTLSADPDGPRTVFGWFDGHNFVAHDAPCITLSDPPTDAQIANVQRLVDKALGDDDAQQWVDFAWALELRMRAAGYEPVIALSCGCPPEDAGTCECSPPEPNWDAIGWPHHSDNLARKRDAAIDTLIGDCPEEVQRTWRKIK